MTRTHKANDRHYDAAATEEHLPKYFAKHGPVGAEPKKIKKDGAGKGNWGPPGNEVEEENFNFANARRRSNSSSFANGLQDFKTKFEVNEEEPVFEERLHGPEAEDDTLAKTDTSSSNGSMEEEDKPGKIH